MKIHLIGVGGIGVSALARYYLERGYEVSGSDVSLSVVTDRLERDGVEVFEGHRENNLDSETDLVIHTVAVPDDNPELVKAGGLGIRTLTYPQALGVVTKDKKSIAVCGAHGKGTTTAFLSLALIEAGLDPTVIVGTNLKEFGDSNLRVGDSELFVLEAGEYRKAFLNYWPQAILLTNIDREHLDCYEDLNDIMDTFQEFIERLPENGILVANKDDSNVVRLLDRIERGAIEYSIEEAHILKNLSLPGEHNLSNALGAFKMAMALGADRDKAIKGLSSYKGAWRRFEIFEVGEGIVVSDYAHHPSEIKATIQATKERWPNRKLVSIFQPHHYHRTLVLFDEFKDCFDNSDETYITNIFSVPGREKDEIKSQINSKMLVKEIEGSSFVSRSEIGSLLKKKIDKDSVVLVMTAGDIYKEVEALVR